MAVFYNAKNKPEEAFHFQTPEGVAKVKLHENDASLLARETAGMDENIDCMNHFISG